jgi:hypothetical protein
VVEPDNVTRRGAGGQIGRLDRGTCRPRGLEVERQKEEERPRYISHASTPYPSPERRTTKKLTLDPDQLQVESFAAAPGGERADGTVAAHALAALRTDGFIDPCICVDQPETRTCWC